MTNELVKTILEDCLEMLNRIDNSPELNGSQKDLLIEIIIKLEEILREMK